MVQLDIAAVQALQRALQRGGFLTRGSQGLSVDSPYAFSEGGAGVGGRRPQRQSSGRSSLSVEGGTGAGGGYYSYAPGGGVMAYFDDGVDGDGRQRRSRLLLPAPPVGRHEAALVWKLFRLARDATALRVHRCATCFCVFVCLVASSSLGGRPIERLQSHCGEKRETLL